MSDVKSTKRGFGRYQWLTLFIALFVLSIVSVLGVNYVVSKQFDSDAEQINLAGRQRMLSQRMVKALQNVQLAKQTGADVTESVKELRTTFELFDNTLNAFDIGGETLSADGRTVSLEAVSITNARSAIDNARATWQRSYRPSLTEFLETDVKSLENLSSANLLMVNSGDRLLALMNQLTNDLVISQASSADINLAGRQRMLTQRIAKSLYEIDISESGSPLNNLSTSVTLFDNTLSAFTRGGLTQNTDGQTIQISVPSSPQALETLSQAQALWQPLKNALNAVNSVGQEKSIQALDIAIKNAEESNLQLLKLMNDLTVALEVDSTERSALLRAIQVAGIVFAMLMFSIIVFVFLRQFRKTDAALSAAKAETDQIMATVNEGLFLLDKEFEIGMQHSNSLKNIFGNQNFSGESMLAVLKKIVPEQTLATAKDYLDLLFGDRVSEELVVSLNPLDQVEVFIENDQGEKESKHLEFSFRRTQEISDEKQLLVQVADITKRVELELELKESEEKQERQFNLMFKVLHVEPDLLIEHISDLENSLEKANSILQERARGDVDQVNRDKIDRMFRIFHSIKGDASGLGLDVFEDKAHEIETVLHSMRESHRISGSDFMPVTIKLEEFFDQLNSLRATFDRLAKLRTFVDASEPDNSATKIVDTSAPSAGEDGSIVELDNVTEIRTGIESKMRNLVEQLTKDSDKSIDYSMIGEDQIPHSMQKPVQGMLTQLLRNSIAHGIESEGDRVSLGKPAEGKITTSIERNAAGELSILFKDDGAGISLDNIRHAAVSKGLLSADKAEQLSNQECLKLMFKPGFSTASAVDKVSGRGVGMDIIGATLNELNGRIGIGFTKGSHSEFRITIPLNDGSMTTSGEEHAFVNS